MAVLAAGALYIAAPAGHAPLMPVAAPHFTLTASLALIFPFNTTVEIPIYYSFARHEHPYLKIRHPHLRSCGP